MRNHFIINKKHAAKDKLPRKRVKEYKKLPKVREDYFLPETEEEITREDYQTNALFSFPTLDECFSNLNEEELGKIVKILSDKLKGRIVMPSSLFFDAYKEVKGIPYINQHIVDEVYETYREELTDILFSKPFDDLRRFFSEEYRALFGPSTTYLNVFEKEINYFAAKKTSELLGVSSNLFTKENEISFKNFMNVIGIYCDYLNKENPKGAEEVLELYDMLSGI